MGGSTMSRLTSLARNFLPARRGLAPVITGAILLLSGTIALASIPDSGGVIHGCFRTANGDGGGGGGEVSGQLRLIDSATDRCLANETGHLLESDWSARARWSAG